MLREAGLLLREDGRVDVILPTRYIDPIHLHGEQGR